MPQPSPSHHQPHFPQDPPMQSINTEGEENTCRTRHSPCGSSESTEQKDYGGIAHNWQSRNPLFSQCNNELKLRDILGSKRIHRMCNFGSTCSSSYAHDSSEVELVVLPNRSRSIVNTSRHASLSTSMVISRRHPFPLLEAISRSISRVFQQTSHLVRPNIIDHIGRSISSSGIQSRSSFNRLLHHHLLHSWIPRHLPNVIPRSSLSNLEHTFRSENSHALLIGHASSTSLEIGLENEDDLRQQPYLQTVLFMQMLGFGILDGSLSLGLTTNGSRGQDILILSQLPEFNTTDLPDRHYNMRLDVDNLSYEELIDLEDHIGNVSTGLSEEEVGKFLKHRKYFLFSQENALEESCSVCQEEYAEEDELGSLECGHEFHVNCITQWLRYKNLCPVCKSTALAVFPSNL